MDNSQFYIVLAVLIAGFAAVFYFMRRGAPQQDSEAMKVMTDWMKSLKDDTDSTRKEIQQSIQKSSEDLNKRLTDAARLFADVQNKVGEMTEVGRGMKDIQDMLRGPKLRGGMGEESLEMLIKQVLPGQSYEMQHKFQNNEIVDCVIKINSELLCIDSKFPLENFRALVKSDREEDQLAFRKKFFSDVKKHIEAISKKYILPQENTYDFALMYVPMESVFQEINNEQDMMDFARSKKVLVTSPSTFYHYLTVIYNSLKGNQINEMAKQLHRIITAIKQDSGKFGDSLSVLTKHLTNAKMNMDIVNDGYRALAGKIDNAYNLQLDEQVKEEIPPVKIDKII
jgi:DNA recombination protein RmuC